MSAASRKTRPFVQDRGMGSVTAVHENGEACMVEFDKMPGEYLYNTGQLGDFELAVVSRESVSPLKASSPHFSQSPRKPAFNRASDRSQPSAASPRKNASPLGASPLGRGGDMERGSPTGIRSRSPTAAAASSPTMRSPNVASPSMLLEKFAGEKVASVFRDTRKELRDRKTPMRKPAGELGSTSPVRKIGLGDAGDSDSSTDALDENDDTYSQASGMGQSELVRLAGVLQTERNQLVKEQSTLKEKIKVLEQEKGTLRNSQRVMESDKAALQSEREAMLKERAVLDKDISQLERSKGDMLREQQDLRVVIDRIEEDKRGVEEQCSRLSQQKQQLEAKAKQLQETVMSQADFEQKLQDFHGMVAVMEDMRTKSAAQQQQVEAMEQELEAAHAMRESAEKQQQAAAQEIRSLHAQLDATSEAAANGQDDAVSVLSAQLRQSNQQRDRILSQLEDATHKLETLERSAVSRSRARSDSQASRVEVSGDPSKHEGGGASERGRWRDEGASEQRGSRAEGRESWAREGFGSKEHGSKGYKDTYSGGHMDESAAGARFQEEEPSGKMEGDNPETRVREALTVELEEPVFRGEEGGSGADGSKMGAETETGMNLRRMEREILMDRLSHLEKRSHETRRKAAHLGQRLRTRDSASALSQSDSDSGSTVSRHSKGRSKQEASRGDQGGGHRSEEKAMTEAEGGGQSQSSDAQNDRDQHVAEAGGLRDIRVERDGGAVAGRAGAELGKKVFGIALNTGMVAGVVQAGRLGVGLLLGALFRGEGGEELGENVSLQGEEDGALNEVTWRDGE